MSNINTWPGWKCVRLLGEGGFGKVYEICRIDEYTGKEFHSALKVISIPQKASELTEAYDMGMNEQEVEAYFQQIVDEIASEYQLMFQLRGHSNIVSYEDHMVRKRKGEFGWDILIRMELLTPLLAYQSKHPLEERDVIALGIDICHALERCQSQNIMHRDIKPENIFVNSSGDFKLGDFGIARIVEATRASLSKKGTYSYMAPEVYKGKPYGPSADIYSLGMVLYRFLNGNREAFLTKSGITPSDRAIAQERRMSGEPLPRPKNGSERLQMVVLKALEYEPSRRFQSPCAFCEALEKIQRGESNKTIQVQPPSLPKPVPRRDAVPKTAVVIAVLCVVLATVVLILAPMLSDYLAGNSEDIIPDPDNGGGNFSDSATDNPQVSGNETESSETEDIPQPDIPEKPEDLAGKEETSENESRYQDIDRFYEEISDEIGTGVYATFESDDGMISYWDGDALVMICAEAAPYECIFCFDDEELVYAYYQGDTSYRFYLMQGELTRCIQVDVDGSGGKIYDSAEFLSEWESEVTSRGQNLFEEAADIREAIINSNAEVSQAEEPVPKEAEYAEGIYYEGQSFHITDGTGLAVYRDIVNGTNNALILGWSASQVPNGLNASTAYLDNDISMREAIEKAIAAGKPSWDGIGSNGIGYFGTFDGQGHCIRDFNVSFDNYDVCYVTELRPTAVDGGAGLFAMNDGTIKNVALSGSINSSVRRTGGLVGINHGVISHCICNVSITSSQKYLGGIAGVNDGEDNSCIEYCANFGDLTNTWATWEDGEIEPKTGGITGGNWHSGFLTSCYNVGIITVESYAYVGGLAGKIENENSIFDSWYPEYCCQGGESITELSDLEFSFEEGEVYEFALSTLNSAEWEKGDGLYPELTAYSIPSNFYN